MVFRIQPQMPARAYKTYSGITPQATHFRDATCQEVGCEAYAFGWRTVIDTRTPEGVKQANYIRLHSGRTFTYNIPVGIITFTFPAGQQCFAQHRMPLEREPLWVVRGGDWRGNPTGRAPRRHKTAADWVDDFATHQDQLAERFKRG